MNKRLDITKSEHHDYYTQYIDQVPEALSLDTALEKGLEFTTTFFKSLSVEQQNLRYAAGKWTPKEVLLHIIDTERIFSYRGLRFGRKDISALVGFDQDQYVANSKASKRSIEDLLQEYMHVRNATISMYTSMDKDAIAFVGEASGSPLSPRAAAFITAGHERHHIRIIKERYL